MHLLDRLKKTLSESFSEPWGARELLRPEIAELSEDPNTGAVSGTLNVYISTKSEERALVLAHPLGTLETDEAVDACVAEALSKLLSVHSSWPR